MQNSIEKIQRYFGANTIHVNEIQFDLPNVESLASRYVTQYEIDKAKSILDAHYASLKSDLLFDYPQLSSAYLETNIRTFLTCNVKGISGLHSIENDWQSIINKEEEYHKNEVNDLEKLFKILNKKQAIEDEIKESLELFEEIEKYINRRVSAVKEIVTPLLS